VLLSQTPPALVGFELDTFWASLAGIDPVTLIERYRGRVPLVHLKDKARGTPVQYDETRVPREAFKEIGQGEIDFGRVLRAAASAGVKYYFVEQDYCPGNPLDSLRLSWQALARAPRKPRPP
jgi:sugar phosphate isomerase/epimerase